MDDFTKLEATKHMLQWLADDPYAEIRSQMESTLQEQVPGSRLTGIRVSSDPQWLTGARPKDDEPAIAILVRTGVAFEFQLSVQEPNGRDHRLEGVFSWVGVHLDDPENAEHRIWFDLDGTLADLGCDGELKNRMYFA
jgi:hypothetical protein